MPESHTYSTAIQEAVAVRLIEHSESGVSYKSSLHVSSPLAETDKTSYYFYKNLTVYVIAAILQFSAANATVNLVTSLAGEDKGFAALVVTYAAGYLSIITPGLVTSLGCKKSIIIVNIGYLLHSIGNFWTEYYALLPAGVFGGYSIAAVWVTSSTYLNALGIDYAKTHKTTGDKMISFTNGIATFCFFSGMLIGNLATSLLLLPTRDNSDVKATNASSDQCSLVPESLSENQWVYFLRSLLTVMCLIALILTVFFLDNMKEEMATKFSLVKLLMDIKGGIVQCGKILSRPNISLVIPWIVACGISVAFLPGTFARVSKY